MFHRIWPMRRFTSRQEWSVLAAVAAVGVVSAAPVAPAAGSTSVGSTSVGSTPVGGTSAGVASPIDISGATPNNWWVGANADKALLRADLDPEPNDSVVDDVYWVRDLGTGATTPAFRLPWDAVVGDVTADVGTVVFSS